MLAVTIRLSIDRFEGDKNQIAVLLAEDGTTINFPKSLLPRGAKPGRPQVSDRARRRGDPRPGRRYAKGPGSAQQDAPRGDLKLDEARPAGPPRRAHPDSLGGDERLKDLARQAIEAGVPT
jgi:hypothetical protein